ncbi:unnamed protein product, partial [marine sediment metagenome]
MIKRNYARTITISLFLVALVIIIFTLSSGAGDIYVDDDADPGWYDATHVKTVQEGVDNASAGDTVYVWVGTYNEEVVVDESVSIIGNITSIVDSGGAGDVFRIESDDVSIKNMTIQNGGDNGIDIRASNITIDNNIIQSNDVYAITISSGVGDRINITNNTITADDVTGGIYITESDYIIIENNNISDCNIGMFIWDSDHNVIEN